MWKNILTSLFIITATVALVTASTEAAFTATATISGINFSTGNASLKLFGNLGYTNAGNNGNLTTNLPGVTFTGLGPNMTKDYYLKYFNTGSVHLLTSIRAILLGDPQNLRDTITVEVWKWDDVDGNGHESVPDVFTLLGGEQTLASFSAHPVSLGQLNMNTPRGLRLRFRTNELPSSTQNSTANFNFIIDGTTEGTTP